MKHIMVFMGTRPEGIKMAPVVRALHSTVDMKPVTVSTGQHQEMLKQVIDLFEIDVDFSLDVMQPNQTLAGLTTRLMTEIDNLLEDIRPDMALIQGDTTTVLVAALACFYRRIPIGHVEAGLRTGNLWSPFPEEGNRRMTSSVTTLHFAPTEISRGNLLREGVEKRSVFVTGNTVIDALTMEVDRQKSPAVRDAIREQLAVELQHEWERTPYVLVTGHRRENFGDGFHQICLALQILADRFPDHLFAYPVHLNPKVRKPIYEMLGAKNNIRLIPPQDYSAFVMLMTNSRLILTDSGGIQEEAPALNVPVLVMRDTTERPEAVDAGAVMLTGTTVDQIVNHTTVLLTDQQAYARMANAPSPYGDGRAAKRIVEHVREYFVKGLHDEAPSPTLGQTWKRKGLSHEVTVTPGSF